MPRDGYVSANLRNRLAAQLDKIRERRAKGLIVPSRDSLVNEAVEEYVRKHKTGGAK